MSRVSCVCFPPLSLSLSLSRAFAESDDIEERVALKSLIDMVQTVLKAVEVETERQAAKSAPSIDVVSETETEVLDAPGDVIAAARTIALTDRAASGSARLLGKVS